MDHGFTREHFELLDRWGNHHFDKGRPAHLMAKASLAGAYKATEDWAYAVKDSLFPHGEVEARKAVINQGHVFSPYNWAKIYPAPFSPTDLAFTVGIDAAGFTVKIDTVGQTPVRAAYLALRGDSNATSPFGAVLPAEDGLGMSFEQLIAWSIETIDKFAIGYEELLERVGLGVPKLVIISDETKSRNAFSTWRQALAKGAIRKGALYWLPEGAIVFRPSRSGRTEDDDQVELGVDPSGRKWAVQVNEPRIAGDYNSLSAIAMSASGELFLLRQGFLRPNEQDVPTLSGAEFVSRSGLAPVVVEAEGRAADRQWFIVCSLDAGPENIRIATGHFAHRCAAARASADSGVEPLAPPAVDLFSKGETGGTYLRRARAAEEERLVMRRHGIVWLALAEMLGKSGIAVNKGLHPLGYEVDAEIESEKPMLVEIKTGTSAGDLHTGVGQLHLYPRLIPRLGPYERVLLLPSLPRPEVRSAVEACGIAIHSYDFIELDGEASVKFSPDFCTRCGVS